MSLPAISILFIITEIPKLINDLSEYHNVDNRFIKMALEAVKFYSVGNFVRFFKLWKSEYGTAKHLLTLCVEKMRKHSFNVLSKRYFNFHLNFSEKYFPNNNFPNLKIRKIPIFINV